MAARLTRFQEELILYFRARFTVLYIVTPEEERVMKEITGACREAGKTAYSWDIADGLMPLTESTGRVDRPARDPISALELISRINEPAVFVLKDFHSLWEKNPQVIRKVKNLAQALKQTKKSIIITSCQGKVPEEILDMVYVIDFTPPDFNGIREILDIFEHIPNIRVNLTHSGREKLIRSALGMTANQVQRVFAKAVVQKGVLDEEAIDLVTREKKAIIRESGALEFFSATETIDQVGGLDVLKAWLHSREGCFSEDALQYGLTPPKGLLLIGIPGTGKSLTAKVVSGLWHQPLIRLDMGAVFGSLVGQSEENIRKALRLAETVSPCVLWIDEVEKGLTDPGGDSGTGARVFGTLLSWMEEKQKPVFVVCTANNISCIPPEFSRAGRFDAIFFLDLPTFRERREILQVHLLKRRPMIDDFDLDAMAGESAGFVGAEIEQAIIAAMVRAFNDGHREFTTDDILHVLRAREEVVPISSSQKENIEALRRWLTEGRARSASFTEADAALKEQVKVPEFGAAPAIELGD
ncbi:MAG: AAA family ATPase [Deltaproteobacteria bacterium]|nr:MAG: AAA family ATPase [Deltaproteobacteria bacterium]HDZ90677.1 AAA family ATPase [Deltaproteobacteria bacterium]